jgi:hypothetical protein
MKWNEIKCIEEDFDEVLDILCIKHSAIFKNTRTDDKNLKSGKEEGRRRNARKT